MTIKELENRTGMTRANIRFYEQEGLLTPMRLENGYRDYSEAEAETLEKIKLFRKLHLDLESIRALQSGRIELAQTLEAQLRSLGTDRDALDRAEQVCRELRDTGTDYASLDPKPWLEALERPPVPQSPRFAPPLDRVESPASMRCPWRRYFARMVDLGVYDLIWRAIYLLGFHWNPPSEWIGILNSYVAFAIMLVVEPLLLHAWGTTLGKVLFGISIRNAEGEKLSLAQARKRTLTVFGSGLGWGIPFYGLYRLWKSYKVCKEEERECWEREDNSGEVEQYRFADEKIWRYAGCAGVYGLGILLAIVLQLQSMMPPNRGELTAAEFYENCNFYMDQLDVNEHQRLDETGAWKESKPDNTAILELLDPAEVQYFVQTDDRGIVTGVSVTYKRSADQILVVDTTDQTIAALALAGSRPQINCLNFQMDKWSALVQGKEWNYDVIRDGLRLTRTTQLEHVQTDIFHRMLPAEADETARVEQVFEIEIVE